MFAPGVMHMTRGALFAAEGSTLLHDGIVG